MNERHLIEAHRVDCDEPGSIVLCVVMHGEYGTESVGAHWHWQPDVIWLEVDGETQEASAWLERMVREWWAELPGMPEAISGRERGAK